MVSPRLPNRLPPPPLDRVESRRTARPSSSPTLLWPPAPLSLQFLSLQFSPTAPRKDNCDGVWTEIANSLFSSAELILTRRWNVRHFPPGPLVSDLPLTLCTSPLTNTNPTVDRMLFVSVVFRRCPLLPPTPFCTYTVDPGLLYLPNEYAHLMKIYLALPLTAICALCSAVQPRILSLSLAIRATSISLTTTGYYSSAICCNLHHHSITHD